MRQYEVHYENLQNGETIAYRHSGMYGPVVVMIHGNQTSSVFFERFMEKFENRCQVYAIDLVGFGDSSYNRMIHSLRDFSADVALFMEQKGLKDAFVLGWSAGGGVALELAADYPEYVQKVILLSSIGLKGYTYYDFKGPLANFFNVRLVSRDAIARDPIVYMPMQTALLNQDANFITLVFDHLIYNRKNPSREYFNRYVEAALKQKNLLDVTTAIAQFNMTHEDKGPVKGSGRADLIKCPIAIIHGEVDLMVDVRESRKTKEYFGDQAKLRTLANAGHDPMTDRPRKCYILISNAIFPRL